MTCIEKRLLWELWWTLDCPVCIRGRSRILLRRGCTTKEWRNWLVRLTNISYIRKLHAILGGVHSPCTLPPDPPLSTCGFESWLCSWCCVFWVSCIWIKIIGQVSTLFFCYSQDFKLKSGQFDISLIPDIYDCIKYDVQHNRLVQDLKTFLDNVCFLNVRHNVQSISSKVWRMRNPHANVFVYWYF